MAKRLDPADNPLSGMRERMLRELKRPEPSTSMAEVDDRIQKESEIEEKEAEALNMSVIDELIRAPLETPVETKENADPSKRRRRFEEHFIRESFYLERDLAIDLRALQDMMREKKMTPFINKLLRGLLESETNKQRLKSYKRLYPDRYKDLEDKFS